MTTLQRRPVSPASWSQFRNRNPELRAAQPIARCAKPRCDDELGGERSAFTYWVSRSMAGTCDTSTL